MKYLIYTVLAIGILYAQTPQQKRAEGNKIYQMAYDSLKAGNHSEAIRLFTDFLNYRPNYINAYFFLAKSHAAQKQFNKAVDYLNKIADQKMNLNPANFDDPDLKNIPQAELQKLKETFAANSKTIGEAKVAFQLYETDIISESVVFSKKKSAYISSVRKRKIIQHNSDGSTRTFADSTQGLLAVFSLKISADQNYLWASSSATKEMLGYNNDNKHKTALFQFDLNSGSLVKAYELPDDGNEHVWGDFIFGDNQQIYISDSRLNTIYVLDIKSATFRKLLDEHYFSSLQGLAFNQDQSKLFCADYSEGIYQYDMETKQVNQLSVPDHIALRGLDGLYFYKNTLIATQNGFRPNRVIQLQLSEDLKQIISYKTLVANHPLIDDPTLGTFMNDQFYFIANSQWSMINRDGTAKAADQLDKPTILKVQL